MGSMFTELRYAVRLLRQSPVFSTFAVLSRALGLAANIAIFSVVNGILLKPLPFASQERLFGIVEIVPKIANLYPMLPVNPRHEDEWKKRVPGIEKVGLAQGKHVILGGGSQPLRLASEAVTPDLLATLQVQPLMGRLIQPFDAEEGHEHVALLTYSLWQGQLGGDPKIIGCDVRLDGTPYRVIGVLPRWFRFPLTGSLFDNDSQPELLTPLPLRLSQHSWEGDFNYSAIARLKPGVRREQALAMLNTAQAAISKTFPDKMEIRADLFPLNDLAVHSSRTSLLLVLGAVGAVLLIVCLNLATLMLARGALRNREIAVRTALGAGRWRLIRESFMEAVVLSAIGGTVGVLLAKAGLKLILAAAPVILPRRDQVGIDLNVLLFALGLTLVTALVFGLYPAWRQSRRDPQEALAAWSRSSTGSKTSTRSRSILVAVEVGLSTVLLMVGGLLIASFERVLNTDLGFEISNHVSAQLSLPDASYSKHENAVAFYDKLLDKLSSQPGIRKAALVSHLPLSGETWIDVMARQGDTRPMFQRPTTNVRFISGSYFEAMGIPLRGGRTFTRADKKNSVAIISNTVAKGLWRAEDPVGRTLLLQDTPLHVIGVAGDTHADIDKSAPSVVYVPYWQKEPADTRDLNVVLRSSVPAADLVRILRQSVAKVDRGVAISHVETFRKVLSDAVSQRRFQMLMVGAFAISALLVAALGIFAVIAEMVSARRNEIGIRMALGASTAGVVGMVIRQGMLPVLVGLCSGVLVTLGFGSAIGKLLYQVRPADPFTFAAVTLLLSGVAVFACWIPARRAARIDPMAALRYE